MALRLIQQPGTRVSAQDDAMIYDYLTNGWYGWLPPNNNNDNQIVTNGGNIDIQAGYFLLKGHLIEFSGTTTIQLSSSGFCVLVLTIDLTQQNAPSGEIASDTYAVANNQVSITDMSITQYNSLSLNNDNDDIIYFALCSYNRLSAGSIFNLFNYYLPMCPPSDRAYNVCNGFLAFSQVLNKQYNILNIYGNTLNIANNYNFLHSFETGNSFIFNNTNNKIKFIQTNLNNNNNIQTPLLKGNLMGCRIIINLLNFRITATNILNIRTTLRFYLIKIDQDANISNTFSFRRKDYQYYASNKIFEVKDDTLTQIGGVTSPVIINTQAEIIINDIASEFSDDDLYMLVLGVDRSESPSIIGILGVSIAPTTLINLKVEKIIL